MTHVLKSIRITFLPDGIEYAVTYQHEGEIAAPRTKKRTTTAARMARTGLEAALEGLDKGTGSAQWGGFATNEKVSKDMIIVDRKESAA